MATSSLLARMNLFSSIPCRLPVSGSLTCLSLRYISSSKQDELYRKIILEVKGHDPAVLNSYQKFTAMAAKELGVHIEKIFEPPRVITRMSLLKSVFVHKKHFHQYEMRTLYRVFELKHLTGSTASTFLEYIQRNLPEGLAMKVTKHQLERIPEHLQPPSGAKDHIDKSDLASISDADSSSQTQETLSISATSTSGSKSHNDLSTS